MVEKIGVEGITSLALTPHAVFTSSKGWGVGWWLWARFTSLYSPPL